MTKENALRLLKHYKETGNAVAYRDMEAKVTKEYGIQTEVKAPTKSKEKKNGSS